MPALDGITLAHARRAVEVLSRLATVRGAFVFGSHVWGSPDEWSDIDVAAFAEGVENWGLQRRVQAAAYVQKEAGDDIEMHFFPAAHLHDPPPASFAAFILRAGEPVPIAP